MRQVKSSEFRVTYGSIGQPVEVTSGGIVIGVWYPAGLPAGSFVTADEFRAAEGLPIDPQTRGGVSEGSGPGNHGSITVAAGTSTGYPPSIVTGSEVVANLPGRPRGFTPAPKGKK